MDHLMARAWPSFFHPHLEEVTSPRAVLSQDGRSSRGERSVARNDQIVRILTVAHALSQSRRGVSLKTLAAKHGWSWRTLYRDLQALECRMDADPSSRSFGSRDVCGSRGQCGSPSDP